MNAIVRAKAMAWVLTLAFLTPVLARAEECRIGPVTVEAPACNVQQGSHPLGPAQYAEWEEGGFIYTAIVVAVKKRASIQDYFSRWRHSHKCSVHEIASGAEVRFAGQDGAGRNAAPPQLTWTGVCITPSPFIVRAIGLNRQAVELHVTGKRGQPAALEPALDALLARVRLSPPD